MSEFRIEIKDDAGVVVENISAQLPSDALTHLAAAIKEQYPNVKIANPNFDDTAEESEENPREIEPNDFHRVTIVARQFLQNAVKKYLKDHGIQQAAKQIEAQVKSLEDAITVVDVV